MNKLHYSFLVFLFLGIISLRAQQDSSSMGHLRVLTEPGIDRLHQNYIEQNKAQRGISGYRVQVYNGKKVETLKVQSKFISAFPDMAVYMLYDAPEYKVQAGDFRTRLEAEKFLNRVIRDFGSGFVVQTRINYPPLNAAVAE